MSDTCQTCGKTLAVGDFPFCPHEPTKWSVISDEVPGGFVVENGFDEPTRFYSKSEHRAALAARGLEIGAKWAGPNDRHLTRWDAVSADQLAKAAELVSRPSQPRRKYDAPEYHVDVTITKDTLPDTFRVGVSE